MKDLLPIQAEVIATLTGGRMNTEDPGIKLENVKLADLGVGVTIVKRALEEPIRQIEVNAGVEGAVIVMEVKKTRRPQERGAKQNLCRLRPRRRCFLEPGGVRACE